MADANGLSRGSRSYPDATTLEMFMYNYPRVRARRAGRCVCACARPRLLS